MLTVETLTPALGGVIDGVDFSRPLAPGIHDAIYRVLMDRLVVFFRGADPTPAAHIALAEGFGALDRPHPLYPHVDGFDRIVKLENDSGAPPDTNSWHTDLTFRAEQPFASILVARAVPETGGDTLWSSNYAAYDRLPDGMKRDLEKLEAVHDMGDFRNDFAADAAAMQDGMARMGCAIRPLIGTHPATGRKFLNFNEAFVTHILGQTTRESNALRVWLAGHMNRPEDQMRWRWRAGDVAIWDNRVTMHYAVADYLPAYRCMNRITVLHDARAGATAEAGSEAAE